MTKLATEGVVQLDDLNTALIEYHRKTGQKATRLVVSPEAWTHLDSIAWTTSYTREYARSEAAKRRWAEEEALARANPGLSQFALELKRPNGMFMGLEIVVDPTLTGLVLRAE